LPGWNCHINAPQEKFYSNFFFGKTELQHNFFFWVHGVPIGAN
jgi:hypothetical protein